MISSLSFPSLFSIPLSMSLAKTRMVCLDGFKTILQFSCIPGLHKIVSKIFVRFINFSFAPLFIHHIFLISKIEVQIYFTSHSLTCLEFEQVLVRLVSHSTFDNKSSGMLNNTFGEVQAAWNADRQDVQTYHVCSLALHFGTRFGYLL